MRQRPLRNPERVAEAVRGITAALLLAACASPSAPPEAHVVVDFPAEVGARDIEIEPRTLAKRARLIGSRLIVSVTASGSGRLSVRTPSTCPLTVDLTHLAQGETTQHVARRWIDVGPAQTDLGPGSKVRVEVRPGCSEAMGGSITWTTLEGELRELSTQERGFVLNGSLPTLPELFQLPLPHALVPVSPRHQGRVVLEARFTRGAVSQVAKLELRALSRSRGLPNVPSGASVLLGGTGWQLLEPASEQLALQSHDGYSLLRPSHEGRWLLQSPEGAELSLRSAAYDQVPLDCTRAACHENLRGHTAGKMSDVLVRGLDGKLGADYTPECALGCHALGEPGVPDGGFQHVAGMLGVDVSRLGRYTELPAALQRLSNVGCLSCHGPGAIPEPSARSSILRSDVCAYCHDAPPRYGHVAAWQQNSMSRAARNLPDPTRKDCARCHTTWGFLEAEAALDTPREPPPAGTAHGLDCVACHDVHQREPSPALLRSPTLPPSADHLPPDRFATSRPCLTCHAPAAALGAERQAWPEASAAAIWLGRGGFAQTAGPLTGPAPHASAPEGCLSCHVGTASGFERGQDHGFQANRAACQRCHERPPPGRNYALEARSLLERLSERVPALRPLTARAEGTAPHRDAGELDVSTALGRAAYNLLLLLEDPAAGIHNPDYAKLLLDHSEGMLRSTDHE